MYLYNLVQLVINISKHILMNSFKWTAIIVPKMGKLSMVLGIEIDNSLGSDTEVGIQLGQLGH